MVERVNDDDDDDDDDDGDDDTSESKNDETPGDHTDYSASSSRKLEEDNHDDDDDDDESVESGSDQAESSSPDASMTDIIPILDELHPLLDTDAPQPTRLSHVASGAVSESQQSDEESIESDEDAENGEGEEEEETDGGKEDESKSAIKWTEDDQKNLMDLGTLELERNQRLESLIARRRARRMMTEKNLIDLDVADLPYNVPPIATTRHNPFDLPDESYAAMGLPPIPGSAPSILQPRRNPFDIPYDPNEEKPDLKGDSFQQEFSMFNQKDSAFFRRHESFSLGPSAFGMSKHERHDINWKPIFTAERMASEGTSYSSFQRQSSEMSDSKVSSVPDTESVSSNDQDESKLIEKDLSQEAEIISNADHASGIAEHGSQPSGAKDFVDTEDNTLHHDEAEVVLGGVENPSEMEFYHDTSEVETLMNAGETQLRGEPNDDDSSSSRSSHSSVSEVIDNIPDEKMENKANMQNGDGHLAESRLSTQTSGEESRISAQSSGDESHFHNASSEVEDNQHVEPVYDSSPPAAEKLDSIPSVSSDSAMETFETALPPASVEMAANLSDKECKAHDERLEGDSSGLEETEAAPSEPHTVVKNEHHVPVNEISAIAPKVQDLDSSDSNYQMASEKLSTVHDKSVGGGSEPNEVTRFENANMPDSAALDLQHSRESHPTVHSEDDVLLSRSMEQGNIDVHQDFDQKMVSFTSDSQHEVDVKSPSIMESSRSSSDKLVAGPSSSGHDESEVESAQAVGTSNNDEFEELHDVTYQTPLNMSSAASEISETTEFNSPTGEVDLEVIRHEAVDKEYHTEAQEHLDSSAESYTSQATEESMNDMKEIDEGFLMELDTVGDFNVNKDGMPLHTNHMSKIMTYIDQEIPILEARSLEDINLAFKQLQEGVDIKEVILPSMIKDQLESEESKDNLETKSDLHVVEARSVEDINIALMQIQEGNREELTKPLDLNEGLVKVEADGAGSTQVGEFADVATSTEEGNRTPGDELESAPVSSSSKEVRNPEDKLENAPVTSSSKETKSHIRKSSSSSSSSSSDSD
ncbi:hypothetical protein PIB30_023287 [Stylosanthes scabra]|uniref:Uncharacterized protein n=1 Tax=Stylosanthes scabra TaxID=79078 RepID=A0ABU6QAE4_9FABA|nr:hypothetical protein [Stylosanthes scabra]